MPDGRLLLILWSGGKQEADVEHVIQALQSLVFGFDGRSQKRCSEENPTQNIYIDSMLIIGEILF